MKQAVHPPYELVVFRDRSTGTTLLTRSTIVGRLGDSPPVVTWDDGRSYPVVDVDVTTASHPFWTGRGRVLDAEGRVERFARRYGSGRGAAR